MITLVFFLEERSARALLEALLPRFVPMDLVRLRFIVFEGKQDLEKQIVRKMRGWRMPDTHFIVLRDQDSGHCCDVKLRLVELCKRADHPEALVRVACHKLESWYLGDLMAVEQSLEIPGIWRLQEKQRFRAPDHLGSPSRVLASLTNERYQKIAGSRAIAPHLRLDGENRSKSFQVFISGVRQVVQTALAGA